MILWYTILDKIIKQKHPGDDLRFIDIRYLKCWIIKYPNCFPKFVKKNHYNILFNPNKLRYEFYSKK